MTVREWQPPPAFNVVATVVAVVLAVGLGWAAWSYYEYSPWSRDGRVRVYTVMVAPEVSGRVVLLPVRDNQFVHKGDLLFEIDPNTFRNDVTQAKGTLAAAKAREGYLVANAQREAALNLNATSAEQKQNTSGIAQAAQATSLQAQGALDQAQLNLDRTKIYASVNGWVTNLLLQEGGYATNGQAAMTLVNADSFWVEGYFAETQLPRIAVGDGARMVLMGFPGVALSGRVAGLGRGISVADATPGVQGLPTVNPVFTWVRLAQRVPVRIELDDVPCPVLLTAGLTATVSILDRPAPPPPAGARRGMAAGLTCGDERTAKR